MSRQYDAVLFDLLSALLDSWSLWDDVAGDSTLGRAWRLRFLQNAAHTERYEPYIALVGESARAVGLPLSRADDLACRWHELRPWPEATDILVELASRIRIGVITNCSEELGLEAVSKLGVEFDVFLTAERAGYYKPDSRTYAAGIREIAGTPERTLYVAGSPYDVCGAAESGMPVFWHNRAGISDPEATSKAHSSGDTLLEIRSMMF